MIDGPSPPYLARTATYAPRARFGPRELVDFELVWLLSGSATWTFQGRPDAAATTHILRPGSVALARPGGVDEFAWDPRTHTSHGYLHFTWAAAPDRAAMSDWPLVRHVSDGGPLPALGAHLLALAHSNTPDARLRTERTLAFMAELFVDGPLPAAHEVRSAALKPVLAWVREQWGAGGMRLHRLDELSGVAGVSAGHLARQAQAEWGCGVIAALELVRLGRAAIDLQRGDASLDQVARAAGYTDRYHFSRRFSATYGSPPMRYRRTRTDDPLQPLAAAHLLPLWQELGLA